MRLTKKQIALCNNEKLAELFEQIKSDFPLYNSSSEAIEGILVSTITKAKRLGSETALYALKKCQEIDARFKGTFMYEFRAIVLNDPTLIKIKLTA